MERLESSKQTEQITQMDAQKTSVSEQEVTAIAPIESLREEKPTSRPRKRNLLPLLIVGGTVRCWSDRWGNLYLPLFAVC
jgi:membrane fusion protein (multidrug efflux system)